MLVPGLACDAAVWQPLWPALQPLARPWVAPSGLHERIGDMAEALLRDAPAERFALAGHSLGGRVALEVMRRAPQRVLRLALLDTGAQPLADSAAGEAEVAQRLALVDLARREGMRAMAERWSPPMLHPAHLDTAVHRDVLDMIERHPLAHFAAQQQALIARPDATDVLDRITCPTLLLCGEEDGWSPPARHAAMAAQIPASWFVPVPRCGHMSTMEQPEAVGRALADWLQRSVAG